LILVENKCEPAPIDGYCLAEKSFITFKCKEGFKLDEQAGAGIKSLL
jgi:hypothetical protein